MLIDPNDFHRINEYLHDQQIQRERSANGFIVYGIAFLAIGPILDLYIFHGLEYEGYPTVISWVLSAFCFWVSTKIRNSKPSL